MSFLHLSYSNHLAISFHNNLYSITLLHLTHTENTRSLTHCTLLPILYQHLCTVLVELASKKQLNVTIMHENRCAPPIIGWINKPYILAVRIGTVLQESSRTENDKKMCLPRIFHPVGCLYPQESATISLQNALKVPYTGCVSSSCGFFSFGKMLQTSILSWTLILKLLGPLAYEDTKTGKNAGKRGVKRVLARIKFVNQSLIVISLTTIILSKLLY